MGFKTAYCLATGPTLAEMPIKNIPKDALIIAVNDAYRLAPFAQVVYACDGDWWNYHIEDVRKRTNAALVTQDLAAAIEHRLIYIPSAPQEGINTEGWKVHTGSNSGYQALNLAYNLGARKIYLLGYDMQPIEGKTHYFGDHPGGLNKHSPYQKFITAFNSINCEALGIEVINCSPNSALSCFKYGSINA